MATKAEQEEKQRIQEQEEIELEKRITREVLKSLGRPPKLEAVQVRSVFDNHYRVNVMTEVEQRQKMTDSFFLTVNGAGQILRSTPALKKKY